VNCLDIIVLFLAIVIAGILSGEFSFRLIRNKSADSKLIYFSIISVLGAIVSIGLMLELDKSVIVLGCLVFVMFMAIMYYYRQSQYKGAIYIVKYDNK